MGSEIKPRAAEHRTVTRVMGILEQIVSAEPEGVRLGDLSGALNAPKSSIHGLVKGLVAEGYVAERDGRYVRGPGVSALLSTGNADVSTLYRSELEELANGFEETAVLSSLVGDSAVHLDAVESPLEIRVSPDLQVRRPLWPLSFGKCFLSAMEAGEGQFYLERRLTSPEERKDAMAELEEIRRSNVASNEGNDLIGVASPIVSIDGKVHLAMGVTGPAFRMRDKLDEIKAAVKEMAVSLSARRPH